MVKAAARHILVKTDAECAKLKLEIEKKESGFDSLI